jgi:hypothetical protein
MWDDDFDSERYRVEQVLEILEHAARRLDERAYVPLSVVRDAVTFIEAAECAAQVGQFTSISSAPVKSHWAAAQALSAMKDALNALDSGDASAAWRFARYTREYLELRPQHLRADDGPHSRRLFDRLAEAAALLDIGAPSAFPTTQRRPLSAT